MAFLQPPLLLFLWRRGRRLRLPFYRCRPLSCCANRGTREGPNHRSNDGETHDSPGYSTSNCATQGAPSGAPGFVSRVLFLVVVHVLPPSWRDDARPLKPTCQRALSFYSLARAGTFERRLVVDLLLGASRLGSDCAAFPCPWRPPSGSFGKGGSFTRPWPGYDMLFCRLIARSPSSKA